MQGNIKVVKRVRISDRSFRVILKCFVADCSASQTAFVVGVNRHTAERYFNFFRSLANYEALRERQENNLTNGIEVDESYFGPQRVRGRRGRGAGRKIIVLGLLKREGRVFTQIIPRAPLRKRSCRL
jgi:transposase-like protein